MANILGGRHLQAVLVLENHKPFFIAAVLWRVAQDHSECLIVAFTIDGQGQRSPYFHVGRRSPNGVIALIVFIERKDKNAVKIGFNAVDWL